MPEYPCAGAEKYGRNINNLNTTHREYVVAEFCVIDPYETKSINIILSYN